MNIICYKRNLRRNVHGDQRATVKMKYKLVETCCKSQAAVQGKEKSFCREIQNYQANSVNRQHGNK